MTGKPTQPGSENVPPLARLARDFAEADRASVISVIQDLVRIPSRGGLDSYDDVICYVTRWLSRHGLPCRRLCDATTGRTSALVCDVVGNYPGPHYVLDACLDTAPFGEPDAWRYPPTSGTIEGGWLHGRGSADSKAAIAIFVHLAKHLHEDRARLHGTLTLLFDADEHTGRFGGAKRYFEDADAAHDVRGVMIGYPGIDELVTGGRGFLRADISVRGQAGHTGSRRAADNINAIEKATYLVQILTNYRTPGPVDDVLDLPPKLTVTGISGGESYSITPDHCAVSLDVRLTTSFDEEAARKVVNDAVAELDQHWPRSNEHTTVTFHESWPAYRLDNNAAIIRSLAAAAQHQLGDPVTVKVAGPSNIGNYLAKFGIGTTAGFGVRYRNLHGTDERIELATIPQVQAVYHEAILTLLRPE